MKSLTKFLPVLAGAVAGGVIALAVAGGSGSSTTTTVLQSTSGSGVPTALNSAKGMTVNDIYRRAASGVVDITVTSHSSGSGFGFFGGGQETQGEGAGVVYDKKGNILTD